MFEITVIVFLASLSYGIVCIIKAGIRYQAKFNGVLVLTLLLLVVGTGSLFITELLNRRCYETALMDVKPGSVILLTDLNDFKVVNDTYGHSVGDLCLIRTAEIMRRIYGRYGQCFRIGGDEYTVLLTRHTKDIKQLNDDFFTVVEQMVKEDPRMTGISLGYAYVISSGENIAGVVNLADQELYRSKQKRPHVNRHQV